MQMTDSTMANVAERVMVAGCGCVLVAGVAALDETVRRRVVGMFTGEALSELSFAGTSLHRLVRTATESLGYGSEGASLLYFAIAAVVILGLMLRS
jgi:hypothetical protein